MADHEAEARKLLRSFYGRTQAEEEAMVAAALLAAERRGIERAADEAEDFLVRIGAGWRKFSHNSSDGKARERMCVERIRSLLSPAAPAPKCANGGTCEGTGRVFIFPGDSVRGKPCPACGSVTP